MESLPKWSDTDLNMHITSLMDLAGSFVFELLRVNSEWLDLARECLCEVCFDDSNLSLDFDQGLIGSRKLTLVKLGSKICQFGGSLEIWHVLWAITGKVAREHIEEMNFTQHYLFYACVLIDYSSLSVFVISLALCPRPHLNSVIVLIVN